MTRQGKERLMHAHILGSEAAPHAGSEEDDDTIICMTYCESFYDFEQCRKVCLSSSPENKSLYIRAKRAAEKDGLKGAHPDIFAAGAIWGWLAMK